MNAGDNNTTGCDNTIVGHYAFKTNTTGIANTDVLIEIINHLINALISGYTAPGGAPCVANGGPEIINAVQKLSTLKSRKYFITKD